MRPLKLLSRPRPPPCLTWHRTQGALLPLLHLLVLMVLLIRQDASLAAGLRQNHGGGWHFHWARPLVGHLQLVPRAAPGLHRPPMYEHIHARLRLIQSHGVQQPFLRHPRGGRLANCVQAVRPRGVPRLCMSASRLSPDPLPCFPHDDHEQHEKNRSDKRQTNTWCK